MKKLHLVGYASDVGGRHSQCAKSPQVIQSSSYFKALLASGLSVIWENEISDGYPANGDKFDQIAISSSALAKTICALVKENKFFTVIGGEHSSAIGTWSGVYDAIHEKGDLGLIWIDAHMDSHTPDTSTTGNIHGMPLASLLGHGDIRLTSILQKLPKLKPQNVCLIGIRSFEEGEAKLLTSLGVKIYLMEEIKSRGLNAVMLDAVSHVKAHTVGFGLSIDIDAIDPKEAPGVNVPEPDGIVFNELQQAISSVATDPKLLGAELVEFDSHKDQHQQTEKCVVRLIAALGHHITT